MIKEKSVQSVRVPWFNTLLIRSSRSYVNGSSGDRILPKCKADRKLILKKSWQLPRANWQSRCSRSLQQYQRQYGTCSPRRKFVGCRCHCNDSTNLLACQNTQLPNTEWYQCCSSKHRLRDLQYSQLAGVALTQVYAHWNVEELVLSVLRTLPYASSRYSNLCRPWWRRPHRLLMVQMNNS